ncbi:hypothetical protein GF340_01155 [Candidatus Peregrinibacteria bacterium]|nr:hypothetical protein [Candidatus Peregrinibacteria bacterium]
MDFLAHIYLLRRRGLLILFTALIISLLGTFFLTGTFTQDDKDDKSWQGTVFISLGTDQNNLESSTTLDNVTAADQFTETVQGWFKNPNLINRINENFDQGISFNARRQEKQNLVITYSFNSVENTLNDQITEHIKTELQNDIEEYNANTNSAFEIALFQTNVEQVFPSETKIILIIVMAAFAIGLFIAYAYEYIMGIVSFPWQISGLLRKRFFAKFVLKKSELRNQNKAYITSLLNQTSATRNQIIAMNINSADLENLAKSIEKSVIIHFPDQIDELDQKATLIVLAKIGSTTVANLEKIKATIKERFILVMTY